MSLLRRWLGPLGACCDNVDDRDLVRPLDVRGDIQAEHAAKSAGRGGQDDRVVPIALQHSIDGPHQTILGHFSVGCDSDRGKEPLHALEMRGRVLASFGQCQRVVRSMTQRDQHMEDSGWVRGVDLPEFRHQRIKCVLLVRDDQVAHARILQRRVAAGPPGLV